MPPHLWPPDAPCWGCEPLLADPSLYADLRRLSEDEKGSLTCQYLGLTTGCCLTLTFIFPIVLLILFGLMRLRPAFIVLSLIVLPPMCFFLSWVPTSRRRSTARRSRSTQTASPTRAGWTR